MLDTKLQRQMYVCDKCGKKRYREEVVFKANPDVTSFKTMLILCKEKENERT